MDRMRAPALDEVTKAFEAFRQTAGFAAIGSEREYEHAIALTQAILEATRDTLRREDAAHPLMALLDWLTPAIREYEHAHFRLPAATPREVLRYLMEQHGLNQSQLPEVGNQSVVSQILSGQRMLNTRQIAGLVRRFGISADAFIQTQALAA